MYFMEQEVIPVERLYPFKTVESNPVVLSPDYPVANSLYLYKTKTITSAEERKWFRAPAGQARFLRSSRCKQRVTITMDGSPRGSFGNSASAGLVYTTLAPFHANAGLNCFKRVRENGQP